MISMKTKVNKHERCGSPTLCPDDGAVVLTLSVVARVEGMSYETLQLFRPHMWILHLSGPGHLTRQFPPGQSTIPRLFPLNVMSQSPL